MRCSSVQCSAVNVPQVLWEVASRYSPTGEVAAYKLPFEAEASPHPSLEEICDLVVTKKVLIVER